VSRSKRRERHDLPVTLAMSPPAVRMVVVQVWAERGPDGEWSEGGTDYQICPVLAILAKQSYRYTRPHQGAARPKVSATHAGMEELGWAYEPVCDLIDFDVVIYDPQYGICQASFALEGSNCVDKAVPCPWPPDEDAQRLAPLIANLRSEARKKAEQGG
jgi:hypothetical protein